MNHAIPFSLHIFVADGDPDGLRFVTRDNWIGKAIVFPRSIFPKVHHRGEFRNTGVYLLLGPRVEGDGDQLYIGEGDPVLDRLKDHYAKKEFWNRAVFFVAGTEYLNKAHVQFLEAQLVLRARAAKRVLLDNGNVPSEPTLSEADRAYMSAFLDNLLGMLPLLGIDAFEQTTVQSTSEENTMLICSGKGVQATGYNTAQGFVVVSGSFATKDEAKSLKDYFPNISKLRAELVTRGVLTVHEDKLRFTQNYSFNSPSQASSVILGNSSNGRADWKNSNGVSLKELEQHQVEVIT
jgi:hypothetical protein